MKKRILSILLVFAMLLGLCACSSKDTVEVIESTEVIESESNGEQASSKDENSGDASNSSGNGSGGGTTVSQKAEKPSNTATGVDGKTVSLANPVYVANGTKAMDEGLDFGGKTFTMAITEESQYSSPQFKRLLAAFQKKYNCKIKTVQLTFENYAQQLTQAKSAGTPYDICLIHGSMFPDVAVSDLVEDITPYLTTADYDTGNGGIDILKSSYFAVGKSLYGLCNAESVFPIVIYYNKALFSKAGLEDPLELYNSGKWTWTKFIEMGKKVTDSANEVYFGNVLFNSRVMSQVYGVSPIDYANGKMVYNFDTAHVQKALKLMQSLGNTYKIIQPFESYRNDNYKSFFNGKTYCTIEESSKFSLLAEQVSTSSALNYDTNNIGIVPVPQDTASAKRGYPTGWFTAISAGEGSKDPRVAVAFAKFQSTYVDAREDSNQLNKTQKELVKKLISGNLASQHGRWRSTSTDTNSLASLLVQDIANGQDIAQQLEKYRAQIINIAKDAGFY